MKRFVSFHMVISLLILKLVLFVCDSPSIQTIIMNTLNMNTLMGVASK